MDHKFRKENRYIIDANVIIDYLKAGSLDLLPLFARHYGTLSVSSLTPEGEVFNLYPDDCDTLGLEIIEPSPHQIVQCNDITGISFPDAVNWILARDRELILITNDKPLWRAAKRGGVSYIRGLRILIQLVECRGLRKQRALAVAELISQMNPYFANGSVMENFRADLQSIKEGAPKKTIICARPVSSDIKKRKTFRSDPPEGSQFS